MNPFFGNKLNTSHKLNLIEKNVLVTSDEEIAKTFKKYFDETVPNLNVIPNECHIKKLLNIKDPVKKLIILVSV